MNHTNSAVGSSSSSSAYTLFSGSLDRCIKHWDLNEMGYIETLFGHQDGVNCLDCHIDNRPISGSRDHTVRLWRINEESHLVYRGQKSIIDCVSILTNDSYLSGDEQGKICLWKSVQKRPIAEIKQAHGISSNTNISVSVNVNVNVNVNGDAEDRNNSGGSNRWITSLSAIKMSDMFASGSSDGYIRLWSVNNNETATATGTGNDRYDRDEKPGQSSKHNIIQLVNKIPLEGFVNGLILTPTLLVAGCGREHKLGRWWTIPGNRNKLFISRLPNLDVLKDEIISESESESEFEFESNA